MTCNKCNAELVPVFPERMRRSTDESMYEGALIIKLSGGYRMFIDEYIPPFILCTNCAQELYEQNEWLITPETDFLLKEEIDGEQSS